MKRVFVLVMALVLMAAIAQAEDLAALSDQELAALNQRVQLELFRRSSIAGGVDVPPGTYYVGIDIPAGRYTVQCPDNAILAEIAIQKVDSIFENHVEFGSARGSSIANITLETGDTIRIISYKLTFKPFTGLFN